MSVDLLTAAKVWWSWVWRSILFTLAISIGIGFLLGVFAAILGINKEMASGIFALVGGLMGIPISIWCLQKALNKYF